MRHVLGVVATVMTLLAGIPGPGYVRAGPAGTAGSFEDGLAAYRAGDLDRARRM